MSKETLLNEMQVRLHTIITNVLAIDQVEEFVRSHPEMAQGFCDGSTALLTNGWSSTSAVPEKWGQIR
jgi:hypothetical protein